MTSLPARDSASRIGSVEPHGEGQLVGPGDHGGEVVEPVKVATPQPQPVVEAADEPAACRCRCGALQAAAAEGDRGDQERSRRISV